MTNQSDSTSLPYKGSIIVPAHNEEKRIVKLLETLRVVANDGYCIVISCNGCTDGTLGLAKAVPGLHVIASIEPSKTSAINRAEKYIGNVFPRLYVDADAEIDPQSIHELFFALEVSEPLAVRPSSRLLIDKAPWLVRTWYESTTLIPSSRMWSETHLGGNAVYGTNESGRALFGTFPSLHSDDGYFDSVFDSAQKKVVSSARVDIRVEATSGELLRTLVRVSYGNEELQQWIKSNRPEEQQLVESSQKFDRSILQQVSYFANGGSTFENWRISTVWKVVVGISLRRYAHWLASLQRRRHTGISWR
jgi:hypothetical protein